MSTESMVTQAALEPCPLCGTEMHDHGHCFSHPRPTKGDCVLRHYSFAKEHRAAWNTRTAAQPEREAVDFQTGVDRWMDACFGEPIKSDHLERADRLTEEALELVQTVPGFTADRAHALVDYVFGRPVGERGQEVGGTMVCLAALCNTFGLSITDEADRELARIWTKVEQIRAKQAAKPTGSALPAAALTTPAPAEGDDLTDEQWAKVLENAPKPNGPLTPIAPAEFPQGGALYVQFSTVYADGSETIRKWSRHPFEGAIRFDAAILSRLRGEGE